MICRAVVYVRGQHVIDRVHDVNGTDAVGDGDVETIARVAVGDNRLRP